MPSESPISSTVQRPIAVTCGAVVVVDDVALLVVVVADVPLGVGAPVANRQPEPGGLKAVMLTIGGGRFVSGVVGGVLGVVEVVPFAVGDVAVVDGVTRSVVLGVLGAAAGER